MSVAWATVNPHGFKVTVAELDDEGAVKDEGDCSQDPFPLGGGHEVALSIENHNFIVS